MESINEKLVDFVKTVNKSSKRSGRPRVLVIAASAIRALELIRQVLIYNIKNFRQHIVKVVGQFE